MTLPDWSLQLAFGRLGWAVIVAAVLLAFAARFGGRGRPVSRLWVIGVVAGCLLVSLLPGRAGLGYWLLMAFQWPSAVLVALSAAACWRQWQARTPASAGPLLPRSWALAITLAGALLYLDVSGWVAWGLYAAGFGASLAPILALAMAGGCVAAIVRGRAREPATILLAALLAYAIGRLPTGNLWDTLFDPLLWLWSLGVTLLTGARRVRSSRQRRVAATRSKDAYRHE